MHDPTVNTILHGAGRDPRECRSEAELHRVLTAMATSTRAAQKHADRMFAIVPEIAADLRQSIAFAQLDRLKALAR
jgi:hypothetical protein